LSNFANPKLKTILSLEIDLESARDPRGCFNGMKLLRYGHHLRPRQARALLQRIDFESGNINLSALIALLGFLKEHYTQNDEYGVLYEGALSWCIENIPTSDIMQFAQYHGRDDAYLRLKQKWTDVIARRPEDIEVIGHAALFCAAVQDDCAAQEFFERCQSLAPLDIRWPYELWRLSFYGYNSSVCIRNAISHWDRVLYLWHKHGQGQSFLSDVLIYKGTQDTIEAAKQFSLSCPFDGESSQES
jgi:hypothetical protein